MKKRIPGFLLCLQFVFTFYLPSRAQAPGDVFKKLASLPLESPQAAALSKYVEFPVGYYNGQSQISLPIYEIVTGDISVPITLSYHGGGIKVQEEASWVGLGWTLNAGGVITHIVKGSDDEVGLSHPFNVVYPDNLGNTFSESAYAVAKTGCVGVYTSVPAPYNCTTLFSQLNGGNTDGEPDIYAYNFGSYSGKFFSGPGQYIDLSHNNILFTQSGTGFTAITPDGYTYNFNAIEKAWSYPLPNATNTAYYLTKITSPTGKIVTFQYKSFKTILDEKDQAGQSWSSQFPNISSAWGNDGTVLQLPSLSENYANYSFITGDLGQVTVPLESYGLHQSYSSTTSTNLYLDRIIFDNGSIDFVKSPRSDLYGVKLDAINISRGFVVKSIPFSYSYFVSNTNDDDMYNPYKGRRKLDPYYGNIDLYPVSYRNQRLKLLSVTIDPSPHNFEYFEGDEYTTLPFKTSFSQDFWGYYNGTKGNNTLIPDYGRYSLQTYIPVELSSWQGANRDPNDEYIRAGLLKRMVYPTGGFSHFSYEMNQFTNLSGQQQQVYRHATYGGVDAGVGAKKFYFTLATETHCDITGGLYCNEMLDMNNPAYNCGCTFCGGGTPDALYASIDQVNPTTLAVIGTNAQWQFDISKDAVKTHGGYIGKPNQVFAAGTYCITVNYPDNHTPPGDIPYNRRAELYVSYYEPIAGQTNTMANGAGLRIKSIKNFEPATLQMMERQFSYTGGKIMRYPVFYSSAKMQYTNFVPSPAGDMLYVADYRFHYLYSSPPSPVSYSANGSAIGYDIVTETLIGTSSSVGKTQYEYKNRADIVNNQPDVYFPGTPTTGYLDNGFLTRVAVYNNNNTLLKETLNQPVIAGAATYWPFKCRMYTFETTTYNFDTYLQMSFYPVPVGKLLTSQTTMNDYANGTTMTTVKNFTYNTKKLLSQESTVSSDATTLTTNYSYASDYTGVSTGWIKDLKDRNMIGVPLEVYTRRNGLVTSGNFSTYLLHDNIVTLDKIYKTEIASASAIASTVPNGVIPAELKLSGTLTYDAYGNLIQSRAENNVYTSYLWGYNRGYPVAQVVGADYAAINALITNWTVSPAVLANPYSTDAQVRQELNNLRTGLASTKALITTFTYAPLIGMTSRTDEKGSITYYSYDSYNRLSIIKDQQNNILQAYNYYYSPTLKTISSSLFYNQGMTKIFNKQCSPDAFGRPQIGTDVPYTVSPEKYAGLTQLAANASAQAEIDANGQARANSQGDCCLYAGPLDLIAVQNGAGTTVNIRYKCPFNVNFCYLFIQDVATGLYVGNGGGPIQIFAGQTSYNALSVPKNKQYKFSLLAGGSSYPVNIASQDIILFLP